MKETILQTHWRLAQHALWNAPAKKAISEQVRHILDSADVGRPFRKPVKSNLNQITSIGATWRAQSERIP